MTLLQVPTDHFVKILQDAGFTLEPYNVGLPCLSVRVPHVRDFLVQLFGHLQNLYEAEEDCGVLCDHFSSMCLDAKGGDVVVFFPNVLLETTSPPCNQTQDSG